MTSERQSPSGGQKLSIERTDHIALVATNVETSVAWHVDMLGFENFGTAAGSIRAGWLPANRRWPEGSPMSISCSMRMFCMFITYVSKLGFDGVRAVCGRGHFNLFWPNDRGEIVEATTQQTGWSGRSSRER